MIREEFLIPEYYVNKIPMCDNCMIELKQESNMLLTNPPQCIYKCPECGKEYQFFVSDIKGEWRWRTI